VAMGCKPTSPEDNNSTDINMILNELMSGDTVLMPYTCPTLGYSSGVISQTHLIAIIVCTIWLDHIFGMGSQMDSTVDGVIAHSVTLVVNHNHDEAVSCPSKGTKSSEKTSI